jgi:hypothetical protein
MIRTRMNTKGDNHSEVWVYNPATNARIGPTPSCWRGAWTAAGGMEALAGAA